MTNKQEHKHCTPEQLYLKMLEIGSECISCGTNLKKIKTELSNCGLISTDDDDTTLKIIFQNSFTHDQTNKYYGNYCKAPEPEFECNPKNKEEYEKLQKAYDDLEHEYECTWFLTPEAMMNLLHLRESTNNRKTSSNAKITSFVALGIALISLFSDWYNKDNPNEILNSTQFQDVQEKISNISTQSNSQSTTLNQLQDDLKPILLDTTTLKSILKNVESLNKK